MSEKLAIKVQIAERFYPLKIDSSEEERIRKAARMINEKLLQYKQRYNDKDSQDFLAMAALQFVIKLLDCEDQKDFVSLEGDLQAINKELDALLNKE